MYWKPLRKGIAALLAACLTLEPVLAASREFDTQALSAPALLSVLHDILGKDQKGPELIRRTPRPSTSHRISQDPSVSNSELNTPPVRASMRWLPRLATTAVMVLGLGIFSLFGQQATDREETARQAIVVLSDPARTDERDAAIHRLAGLLPPPYRGLPRGVRFDFLAQLAANPEALKALRAAARSGQKKKTGELGFSSRASVDAVTVLAHLPLRDPAQLEGILEDFLTAFDVHRSRTQLRLVIAAKRLAISSPAGVAAFWNLLKRVADPASSFDPSQDHSILYEMFRMARQERALLQAVQDNPEVVQLVQNILRRFALDKTQHADQALVVISRARVRSAMPTLEELLQQYRRPSRFKEDRYELRRDAVRLVLETLRQPAPDLEQVIPMAIKLRMAKNPPRDALIYFTSVLSNMVNPDPKRLGPILDLLDDPEMLGRLYEWLGSPDHDVVVGAGAILSVLPFEGPALRHAMVALTDAGHHLERMEILKNERKERSRAMLLMGDALGRLYALPGATDVMLGFVTEMETKGVCGLRDQPFSAWFGYSALLNAVFAQPDIEVALEANPAARRAIARGLVENATRDAASRWWRLFDLALLEVMQEDAGPAIIEAHRLLEKVRQRSVDFDNRFMELHRVLPAFRTVPPTASPGLGMTPRASGHVGFQAAWDAYKAAMPGTSAYVEAMATLQKVAGKLIPEKELTYWEAPIQIAVEKLGGLEISSRYGADEAMRKLRALLKEPIAKGAAEFARAHPYVFAPNPRTWKEAVWIALARWLPFSLALPAESWAWQVLKPESRGKRHLERLYIDWIEEGLSEVSRIVRGHLGVVSADLIKEALEGTILGAHGRYNVIALFNHPRGLATMPQPAEDPLERVAGYCREIANGLNAQDHTDPISLNGLRLAAVNLYGALQAAAESDVVSDPEFLLMMQMTMGVPWVDPALAYQEFSKPVIRRLQNKAALSPSDFKLLEILLSPTREVGAKVLFENFHAVALLKNVPGPIFAPYVVGLIGFEWTGKEFDVRAAREQAIQVAAGLAALHPFDSDWDPVRARLQVLRPGSAPHGSTLLERSPQEAIQALRQITWEFTGGRKVNLYKVLIDRGSIRFVFQIRLDPRQNLIPEVRSGTFESAFSVLEAFSTLPLSAASHQSLAALLGQLQASSPPATPQTENPRPSAPLAGSVSASLHPSGTVSDPSWNAEILRLLVSGDHQKTLEYFRHLSNWDEYHHWLIRHFDPVHSNSALSPGDILMECIGPFGSIQAVWIFESRSPDGSVSVRRLGENVPVHEFSFRNRVFRLATRKELEAFVASSLDVPALAGALGAEVVTEECAWLREQLWPKQTRVVNIIVEANRVVFGFRNEDNAEWTESEHWTPDRPLTFLEAFSKTSLFSTPSASSDDQRLAGRMATVLPRLWVAFTNSLFPVVSMGEKEIPLVAHLVRSNEFTRLDPQDPAPRPNDIAFEVEHGQMHLRVNETVDPETILKQRAVLESFSLSPHHLRALHYIERVWFRHRTQLHHGSDDKEKGFYDGVLTSLLAIMSLGLTGFLLLHRSGMPLWLEAGWVALAGAALLKTIRVARSLARAPAIAHPLRILAASL